MESKLSFWGAIAWCEQHNLSFSEECRYMETALKQCMSILDAERLNKEIETGICRIPNHINLSL